MKKDFFETQFSIVEKHKQAMLDSYRYMERAIESNLDIKAKVDFASMELFNTKVAIDVESRVLRYSDNKMVNSIPFRNLFTDEEVTIIALDFECNVIKILDYSNVTYE